MGTLVASPIHTSSHYQTFETPYLHELVGGDRNIEQTNLVVTSDGKTWDEVTRDVSYIGNLKCKVLAESNMTTANAILPMHYFRGSSAQNGTLYGDRFTKDFAIGYDCLICLVAGQYKIIYQTYSEETLVLHLP